MSRLLAADLACHPPQPAGGDGSAAGLRVHARAERRAGELRLAYTVAGPIGRLRIPPPQPRPRRRDGLWRHTCLEAFLAVAGEEAYWELNLAPSGDWNWYRLDGYRRNLRPDPALQALPLSLERSAGCLALGAVLPLPPPLAAAAELDLALTAVLEPDAGELSYWALAHPPEQPDFHWRGGWRRCR